MQGKGNDPDTSGKRAVFVYDTEKFPFHAGEVYHQVLPHLLLEWATYGVTSGPPQVVGQLSICVPGLNSGWGSRVQGCEFRVWDEG